MKKLFSFTLILTLLMTIGCSIDESNEILQSEDSSFSLLEILSSDALLTDKRPQPPLWADCYAYTGLVVPATFKPGSGNFDELYVMPKADGTGMFMFDGKPLISDSKPGDQDYNGGRWHLNVIKSDDYAALYSGACSEEDLNTDHFMSTNMYFECPLKKVKN